MRRHILRRPGDLDMHQLGTPLRIHINDPDPAASKTGVNPDNPQRDYLFVPCFILGLYLGAYREISEYVLHVITVFKGVDQPHYLAILCQIQL